MSGLEASDEVSVRVESHRGAHGGIQVLSVSGDLDWAGVQELRGHLPAELAAVLTPDDGTAGAWHAGTSGSSERVHQPGAELPRLVVFDLAGVGFIDSSGLGTLVALHRRLQRDGRSMALCCLQEQPRRVVAATAVDTLFAVHPHLSQALGPRAHSGGSS